ncbi:lysozyme [Budviciaceae bacterium BWR-B9]|uniref:Lysozyme n=1 Tax=Limnobaculum allomyrinae TaxID=2791986 RepID=A0ABS1IVT1_9GAMM|nr:MULTISPECIES: lysozyme [Limnobaculum]MBK5145858.1 lysozyme [Limnobaculum allomyrinae]MBV7693868.1 lysozyme [Limnobaculum sp. M2-1]
MITSQVGINTIKAFESLRLGAYLCPADVWTIGYGHTDGVKRGDLISADQAERFLKGDVIKFEQDITRLVKVPLTQGQFDALVSFVFNVGTRAFSNSTMLRKINARDFAGAANEFSRWVYANGKRLAGLERRRRAEKKIFES